MKHYYVPDIKKFKKEYIEEQDYYLGWELFHEKHPTVDKWEYDQKVKELQEM